MEWLTEEAVQVGDGHELRVRTFGTPGRIPIAFLHGGPGSGVNGAHMAIFDPRSCHVVAFDQRGAGSSRPHRGREANTTQHLIADMELLRRRLGFGRWLLVGGSWGATLALAYAQQHPDRVLGLVLRATFLGTRAELEWAFGSVMRQFHPELHEEFLGLLPDEERADPLPAYWSRILHPDPDVHLRFAWAWHVAERTLSQLAPATARFNIHAIHGSAAPVPASPFMEAHYFSNDCFLAERPLLHGAWRLEGIPGVLVQGRYDLLCPPATARALQGAWPDARIRTVEAAGHALEHDGVRIALTEEVAGMVAQLTPAGTA